MVAIMGRGTTKVKKHCNRERQLYGKYWWNAFVFLRIEQLFLTLENNPP